MASARQWIFGIAAAALLVVIIDWQLGLASSRSDLVVEAVDVHTPETYLAKLTELHDRPWPRIVLIGDSQVVGATMAEHGDGDWRRHTLDRQIEARLRRVPGFANATVVNIGANGLLPADEEWVVKDAIAAGANAVVLNVSIRAFSKDFDRPEDEFARPWLVKLCRESGAPLPRDCTRAGLGRLSAWLGDAWWTYRVLDLIETRFLGGPLKDLLPNAANRLFRRLRGGEPPDDDASLALMLRARARFESVDFDPGHRQVVALKRMLNELAKTASVVYYTKENPLLFNQLMEPAKAEHVRQQILAALEGASGHSLRVMPPVADLRVSDFLDFMHLNQHGYSIMADHIVPALRELLPAGGTRKGKDDAASIAPASNGRQRDVLSLCRGPDADFTDAGAAALRPLSRRDEYADAGELAQFSRRHRHVHPVNPRISCRQG